MNNKKNVRLISRTASSRFFTQAISIALILFASLVSADEVPWEFDPYRMRVWLSVDPSIPIGDKERTELESQIGSQLDLVYQASAVIDAQTTLEVCFRSS